MEKRIPKGVCLFAYNTPQFDYIKLAIVASTYVKKHLNLPVCLITDEHGEKYYDSEIDSKVKEGSIDYIVTTDDNMKQNIRGHFDSPWTEFRSQFNNSNKPKKRRKGLHIQLEFFLSFFSDGFYFIGVSLGLAFSIC